MLLEYYVSDEIPAEFFMLEAEKRSSSFLPWVARKPADVAGGRGTSTSTDNAADIAVDHRDVTAVCAARHRKHRRRYCRG